MGVPPSSPRRNLFEIDNARNLTKDELVATFVPTKSFGRLLNSKNHVILGSRGSGKTVLAKMLSHDHLSKLDDDRARSIINSKALIGIYVPMRLEWVGGLRNKPWQNEREQEEFFSWRLNIATCNSFLGTLDSCLESYVLDLADRLKIEKKIVEQISKDWSNGEYSCSNIKELKWYLEDIEYSKQQQIAKERFLKKLNIKENFSIIGLSFLTELFTPLKRGIDIVGRMLNFPDTTTWVLCLDEAEFLDEIHHRIINSFMRAYSGNLSFKITTMPYFHHTLETNSNAPLNVGHDFEYIYIDQELNTKITESSDASIYFATNIFNKRAEISGYKYKDIKLREILGDSILLDDKSCDWESKDSHMYSLLKKYCTRSTISRADALLGTPAFRDQIGRKVHGALLLKEAVENYSGRSNFNVYSGLSMAIRCSDGNPRMLIRIFNNLLFEVDFRNSDKKISLIPQEKQNKILNKIAVSTLNRIQSEPVYGHKSYLLINMFGNFVKTQLHDYRIGTDQISSVSVDSKVDKDIFKAIKYGVALGLLYPNINQNNPDQMPEVEGTFHLAYVLAPFFKILPRRGSSRTINSIYRDMNKRNFVDNFTLSGQQINLFEE